LSNKKQIKKSKYVLFSFFMFLFQIALAAIFLIDNGMTGSMRSGRARKEYQGKGMLRKLNNELIKHHPTVKYASLRRNITGVTSGTGTAYPSEEPEFTPFLWGSCC
jgi:hypothetical protein